MKGDVMPTQPETHLSRRERQIMDILYARGQASVAEVRQVLADAPGYSAVRALMRIMEEKGHLKHRNEGARYIYLPTRNRKAVSRAAASRLLATFFDNSVEQAVAALLEARREKPSQDELQRLAHLIDQARKEGR
jgi:BlaI family transcriptional regulator, penicillinase repressor